MDLWRRIKDGEVGECTLLSFVISSQSNRHTKYQQSTDCVSVEVHFRYLEGTLIPFDDISTDGKLKGVVPQKIDTGCFDDLSQDERLFGFECYEKKNGSLRYFKNGCFKYYRLGITFRLEIFAMLSDLQAKQETSFISGITVASIQSARLA